MAISGFFFEIELVNTRRRINTASALTDSERLAEVAKHFLKEIRDMTAATENAINAAAAGKSDADAVIYWDDTDPANPGPAYRLGDESGSLDCIGWIGDGEGLDVADYFTGDGAYKGPDIDGAHPRFMA